MKINRIMLLGLMVLALAASAFALPNGANVFPGTPETNTPAAGGAVKAEGGNVTLVNVGARSQTRVWQGYFGEVNGNLTLEDASADLFFNWSVTNPDGEVYASRNSTMDFTTVAGVTDCTVDETLTGPGRDKTSRTFALNATLTPAFEVGAISISSACQVFTHTSSAPAFDFEEIIINATGVTSIYTARINSDTVGFDGATHDYQMIVPDDPGVAIQTYYFFAEFT